jgi:nucleoid-associated protein YejK
MLYKFSLEGEIIHSIHFGEPQKSDAGFDLLIQGDFLHITGYAFQPTLMHKSIVYLVLSKNLEILNSSYFEVNHIQIGNRITHKEEQILISGQALDADSKFVVVTEIPTSFIESKSRNITFTIKSLFDTWLIEFSENVEDFSLFSITGIRINGKFNHISLNQIEIKKPEFSGFFILKVKLNSKIFSIKLVL